MVKLISVLRSAFVAGALIPIVAAHPGEHHSDEETAMEIRQRDIYTAHIKRGLSECASSPKLKALRERAAIKRFGKANAIRKKRGISTSKPFKTRRDLATLEAFEAVNHNYTSEGFTSSTDYSTLFAYYENTSCILTPEVTQGPYYVSGEYIRTDIAEDQDGVPLHIEFQFIDTSTCDAVEDLYIDIWHANATGVYSGVEATGNGNGYEDPGNLDNTFCRGLSPTDSDGIVSFDTIFVGHYVSRATHIHMTAHQDGTVLSNQTYSGGSIVHTGQIFFPESLKDEVYALSPYSSDTQAITTNDEDNLAPDAADNDWDPLPDYAYLGDSLDDGLLMWISIGVDTSASYTISAAAELTADGGVVENSSGTGGSTSSSNSTATVTGVSMPSGSGGMPSGSGGMSGMPSGANATSTSSSVSSLFSATSSSISTPSTTMSSASSSKASTTSTGKKSSSTSTSAKSLSSSSTTTSTTASTAKTSTFSGSTSTRSSASSSKASTNSTSKVATSSPFKSTSSSSSSSVSSKTSSRSSLSSKTSSKSGTEGNTLTTSRKSSYTTGGYPHHQSLYTTLKTKPQKSFTGAHGRKSSTDYHETQSSHNHWGHGWH